MKSLAKNSLYNIIYQALMLVFPMITSMYVSRIILEDGVGKVAYAQNIVSYFTALAATGFPAYGIREIAKVSDNQKEKNKSFSEMFLLNAAATTLAAALYIVLIFFVPAMKNNLYLYLSTGLLIILNYANIDWLYQGLEEYEYIMKRSCIVKILSLTALFLFVRSREDYVNYALITSMGTACNNLFNIYHSRKLVKITFRNLELRRHVRPLLILTAAAFLGSIYNKIDVTMLGAMSTDSVVGYYSNAHKTILLVETCCTAISAVFLPRISYYYKNDRAAMNNLVEFGTKMLLVITIPATVGIALLAEDTTVLFYGENFRAAGITLAVFAPLLIIRSLGNLLCYQLLISVGEEKKRLWVSAIATIVNILLNAALIPIWAQNGAAVASVISELVVNGILLYFVLKIVKIRINTGFLLKTIVSTLVMAVGVIAIKTEVSLLLPRIVVSLGVGIPVYFGMNCLLKNETVTALIKKAAALFLKRNSK